MNYYLITFQQLDGEHEHHDRVLAKAPDDTTLRIRCDMELYQFGQTPKDSMFSYGDGQTAVTQYAIKQIPKEHYLMMSEGHYLNELPS